MIRKLVVVLLSGALCLLAAAPLLAETNWWSSPQEYEKATGNKIEKFQEAPMLRVKVAAGELPSIEERLPEEPLVEKPLEEVGIYGGTLRMGMVSMSAWFPAALYAYEYMLNLDRKGEKVVPNIAKDWEFSDKGKTFTLYLRKRMKWSNGASFTADDILFWWEDVILNDEITPVKPARWMRGGKLMTVEKVDDYTVRLHFGKPYQSIIWNLSGFGFSGGQDWFAGFYLPKDTLKKYHINYNPKADELAKEEGYDHWWQLFNAKKEYSIVKQPNPDIPCLAPWVVKQILPEGVVYERNPYYFKIDTAGNQLPYIDTVKATPFGDMEILTLKVVSGEYDYHNWELDLKNFPVLTEEAEKGGYKVWLAPSLWGSRAAYYINQNYNKDPVVGDILRNVRFRQALSLAIDREEINELLALGKGVPRQATVLPNCSFYKEEWGEAYAEYDPERANRLLDEMGLNKRDKDGFRLRSDGKTLHIVISHVKDAAPILVSELVRDYWEKVGVKTPINPVERSYMMTCYAAGTYMVAPWAFEGAVESSVVLDVGEGNVGGKRWAPQWYTWWSTKGEKGEEPPEEVKRMFSLADEAPYLPQEERNKVLTEIFDIWAENVWMIGTVGMVPQPYISNIYLGNVNTDTHASCASTGCDTFARAYQFFWKK